jgi:hypothetical protein
MATFNRDLTVSSLGRLFRVQNGLVEAKVSGGAARGDWDYETLAELFERVVTRYCISHYGFIGRTYRMMFTITDDIEQTLGLDRPTWELVQRFDRNALYWSHNGGGHGEGIAGWLDAEEAKQLAAGLSPSYSLVLCLPTRLRPVTQRGRAPNDVICCSYRSWRCS